MENNLVEYCKRINGVQKIAFNIKGGYSLQQEFDLLASGKTTASMLKRSWAIINYLRLLPKVMQVTGQGVSNYSVLATLKKYSPKLVKAMTDKKLNPQFLGFNKGQEIDLD